MIVVIADDFTGAAELGGLALRYNLKVEITSNLDSSSDADVLVIATDARSMSEQDAVERIDKVCDAIKEWKPSFVFKKIDSVLRGHVLAEIDKQVHKLGCDHVLIVPANPRLGRTIKDGIYYLHEMPIHLSDFNHDPEFPIRSSHVADMLRTSQQSIKAKRQAEVLVPDSVVVGDVQQSKDLVDWASVITDKTLVAGAAEFFDAVLQKLGYEKHEEIDHTALLRLPALMVLGSGFRHHKYDVSDFVAVDRICYVPVNILEEDWYDSTERKNWIDKAVKELSEHYKALIATHGSSSFADPLKLRTRIAEVCAEINSRININEWLIEGGATAACILKTLRIQSLYPLQELAPGVIRMGAEQSKHLHFTLKPGSYDWPASILSLSPKNNRHANQTA